MRNKPGIKTAFIVNPVSGTGKKTDYRSAISRASKSAGFEWDIFETTGENDPEQIRHFLQDFNPQRVITMGGDGTVNMVAAQIAGQDVVLGIIPAGSANGLAHNIGIPVDFDRALDFNLNASAHPMDMISINDTYYCLHLSDVGINARIVKRFEKEGSKGLLGYGKQLFKELFHPKTSFSCYLQFPGQPKQRMKAEMLIIANAKRYGTGAIINPTGQLNDGKFEVVIIRPYPWWFVFSFVYAAFLGKLHKMKYAKIFSVEKVTIRFPESHEFQVDGEIVPDVSSLKIKILPGEIQVVGIY